MSDQKPNPSDSIRQILLETLTFGYDTGQGVNEPRGYNIDESEKRLNVAIEVLIGLKIDAQVAALQANHAKLVEKLENTESLIQQAKSQGAREEADLAKWQLQENFNFQYDDTYQANALEWLDGRIKQLDKELSHGE